MGNTMDAIRVTAVDMIGAEYGAQWGEIDPGGDVSNGITHAVIAVIDGTDVVAVEWNDYGQRAFHTFRDVPTAAEWLDAFAVSIDA